MECNLNIHITDIFFRTQKLLEGMAAQSNAVDNPFKVADSMEERPRDFLGRWNRAKGLSINLALKID